MTNLHVGIRYMWKPFGLSGSYMGIVESRCTRAPSFLCYEFGCRVLCRASNDYRKTTERLPNELKEETPIL